MNKVFFLCLLFGFLSLNLYSIDGNEKLRISEIKVDSNVASIEENQNEKKDRKPHLIIVDGAETTARRISDVVKKEDIRSITIYKDIDRLVVRYGEKARNGVIIVVTKQKHLKKRISRESSATGMNKKGKDLSREDIKSVRLAFISSQLNLTTEVAEKFWPMYNEYIKSMIMTYEESKDVLEKLFVTIESNSKYSESEYAKLISDYLSAEGAEVKTMNEYYNKFKEVLSQEQIARLYYAEHQFKIKMLRKLKTRDIK